MTSNTNKRKSPQKKKTMVLEFDTFRQTRSLPSAGGLTWKDIDAHHWDCVRDDLAQLFILRAKVAGYHGLNWSDQLPTQDVLDQIEDQAFEKVESAFKYLSQIRRYQEGVAMNARPDVSRFFDAASRGNTTQMQLCVDQTIAHLKMEEVDHKDDLFFRKLCLGAVTNTADTLHKIVGMFWQDFAKVFDPDFEASADNAAQNAYDFADEMLKELKPMMTYTPEYYGRIMSERLGLDEAQLHRRLGNDKGSVLRFPAAKKMTARPV